MKNCKTILLALLLVASPAAWAQYSTGTNLLAQTNITGAFNAFNSAASASNPNAEVYLALTRLLALPSNSPAGTFLNELGISPTGRNVFHWRAKPETNSSGHKVIPVAFNPDEFTGELRNDVVPTLIASEGNLAQITDTSFTLLMPRSVTHFGGDVTIDYGDVQMLRAMMDAETVFMYKLNTWNLNVPYGSASNIIKNDQSIQTLLTDYPSLLALTNASDFTLARTAFTNGVSRYLAASQFIRNRSAGGATRLFNLGTNAFDLNSEQNFRTFLTDLQSSLGAPFGGPGSDANAIPGAKFFGAISGFTNRTFSLSNFLSGQNSIRPLLPTFASQKADFIWDSFPDPTLGGVVTGLTETNLGKLFVQSLHAGAELNVPGVTATVVSTVTDHSGLEGSLNGVVQGTDGNFYGTVPYGGNFGSGAFFRATPSGAFTVLYSFGGVGNATGSQLDGGSPSGLVISGGNFYGTTPYGGSNGNGTIFKITPGGSLTTLYSFGDQDDDTITGGNPLIFAGGSFYGTTPYGGDNGGGVIFQVTLSTGFGGSHVAFNELYSLPGSFSPFAPNGTGVGAGALVRGSDGNLYGATQYGGDGGGGSLFQFIPGSQNPYYEFSFPAMYDQFGDQIPLGINTVVQGSDGVFYGTTQYGGDLQDSSGGLGDGMIFSIDTNGNFTTLYNFDENNFDGFNPTGPLVQGGNGVFYGITSSGGANGVGTIFSFTPGGVPNFLVWFNENLGKQQGSQNGNAGFYYNTTIAAGLIAGTSGFYGTAPDGGTNGDGTIFNFNVFNAATILSSPASVVGIAGSTVGLTVSAGGSPVSYQWRRVGSSTLPGNTSGGTTASLTFTGLTASDVGSYFVVVSNTHGSATSDVAVLTILTPVTITTQPAATAIVPQGQALRLNIFASGTGPFTYQWYDGNFALSDVGTVTGSLTSNLLINPAANSDSGSYYIIVSSALNSVTSQVSTVNVGSAPFVYSPPNTTNVLGSTVTLTAEAGGALPLAFKWRKNGTVLANSGTHVTGATTASLMLAGLTSADAGSYSLVVTNAFGGATSAVTVLTVVPPPMITTQPVTPLNVAEGGNLGLHVGVNGTGTLTYQWFSNNVMVADGGNVSGSAAANLVINPASLGNSGSYFVIVSNTFGSATSIVSVVTVGIGPSVMAPPSTTNLISSGVTLPAVASGTMPLHYQWRKNTTGNASSPVSNSGSHVTGATNATLTLSGLIPADAGSYFIVVTNAFGAATSTVTVLTVVPPPIFTTQPATPVNIAQGQALNLSVGVSGTGPLSYQWIVNNTNLADGGDISGSATTALVINPAFTSNSGSYSVVVSNAFGSITSHVSLVTVGIGPGIITPPADTNDLVHSNVVLTVSADGTAPLHYQWKREGAPMGSHATGATTSSLTLSALALTDAGSYFVVVTNTYGSVTSAVAVLVVNAPPTIPTPLAGPGTVLQGQTLSLRVGAVGTSPLFYQWLTNSVSLADDTNTTGSATSNLVLNRAYTNDSASYSVVITNAFGSITGRVTVVVSPDRTVPTVTVTSPASDGARSNAPVTFLGNAFDNVLVTNVSYSISNLNGAAPIYSNATLTVGPGSISNWSISISPAAGSNILTVQSQDFSGNSSAPAARKFFLKSPVALPVAYAGNGNGTASGHASFTGDAIPTNGALLNVGESYTITATPGANCYFVNWTGTAGTTNGPTLSFIMQSNTSLTATFITNIFIGMAGTYNGLFSSDALGVTEETAGMIGNLVLTSNGTYTATVYLGGSAPSISGSFSHDAGYASNQISTTLDKFVKVELFVNANTAPRTITGFVIGTNNIVSNNGVVAAGWTSAVNLFASTNNTRADSGDYTVLIPPLPAIGVGADSPGTSTPSTGGDFSTGDGVISITMGVPPVQINYPAGTAAPATTGGNSGVTGTSQMVAHPEGARTLSDQVASGIASPSGTGYLLLTNNPGATPAAAIVKITGALADGTVISQTVPIGEDNGIPVYQSLYTTTSATTNGLLFGRLSLAAAPAPSGTLVWIKKASSSGLFGAGFTNPAVVLGSYWSNSLPIANVILPNSPLILSGGGLTASLPVNVSVSGTNLLALGAPANFGPASINTNTGQLTIMFTNGIRRTGFGAVLQDTLDYGPSYGAGFFLMGTTNAGSMSLQVPAVGN